jgi:alginate O-acetyltransferase complex protein AlgI
MLFNSYQFALFFVLLFWCYTKLQHKQQNILLLVGSYFFYGCWDWRFLSLILLSTTVDYVTGIKIDASLLPESRKWWLAVSVVINLGILGIFKYFNFFSEQLVSLLTFMGTEVSFPTISLILPVGISFYTFQTMSYSIDVYRNQIRPTRNFIDYALYVSFFPQLVAGPIERSTNLIPQVIQERKVLDSQAAQRYLYLIGLGLFAKVVIADNMAALVDTVYLQEAQKVFGIEVVMATYAFAFQVYGDFLGYSTIACGVAGLMGFHLMENFRRPYFATNPSDFWRRWHISLSTWLRDYLYIPLGGNRTKTWKMFRNLLVTMVLCGLWHGAAWHFIMWGLFHGVLLCGYRLAFLQTPGGASPNRPPHFFYRVLTGIVFFNLICVGWLLFRAESMGQALAFMERVGAGLKMTSLGLGMMVLLAFYVVPFILFEWYCEKKGTFAILDSCNTLKVLVCLYGIIMIVFFSSPEKHDFIYFQF